MKRDMSLVRKLILSLEDIALPIESDELDLEVDQDSIDCHLRLMIEAGLITGTTTRGGVIVSRLTWAGHDFADASRDDVVWKKAIRHIGERTKSVTFDVLISVLKGILTKTLSD